jgi:hypothetical protein
MRTFFIMLSATLAFAAQAEAATRNYAITGFTKIRIEGPYKVVVSTGVPPFAKAAGSPAALDRVAIDVRGDTLVVRTDPSAWGGYPGMDPGPVEISIGTHELGNVSLNGSGSVAINRIGGLGFGLDVQGSGAAQIDQVAVDQLNVNLAGTPAVKLAGKAKRLTAAVRGLATLDAAKLEAPSVHISAQGSATIDAVAHSSAEVQATGPATIRFTGSPSCELHLTGSASISGCK